MKTFILSTILTVGFGASASKTFTLTCEFPEANVVLEMSGNGFPYAADSRVTIKWDGEIQDVDVEENFLKSCTPAAEGSRQAPTRSLSKVFMAYGNLQRISISPCQKGPYPEAIPAKLSLATIIFPKSWEVDAITFEGSCESPGSLFTRAYRRNCNEPCPQSPFEENP
jgi:hypothetical protein